MDNAAFRTTALAFTAALAVAAPAKAGVTVTNGFHDSNTPFNFVLNPGEYFTLDFGAASFASIRLENFETGQVISSFYVEIAPGVFDVGNGIDDTLLVCAIATGGNCTDNDFGPVQIQLSESGGLISGNYTFGPQYYDCFGPGAVPVDGQECGRDFTFLPRMLFDLTFNDVDTRLPYTLSVSTGPFPGGVPEPTTWALMILGFGVVGAAQRRRAAVRFAIG